jgi:hypothetical protein
VEQAGFGAYSSDPAVIASTVQSWLQDPEKLASMKRAALKAARPTATLDIARDIGSHFFVHQEARKNAALSTSDLKVSALER